MSDTQSKLNQQEAGRVKTEMDRKYKKNVLHRELWGYTPEQIAASLGLKPEEVAKMAGRDNGSR